MVKIRNTIIYKEQPSPDGLAQAFIIGRILLELMMFVWFWEIIFFMDMVFLKLLRNARKNVAEGKSTVFGYYVNDPERYGVAEFDR